MSELLASYTTRSLASHISTMSRNTSTQSILEQRRFLNFRPSLFLLRLWRRLLLRHKVLLNLIHPDNRRQIRNRQRNLRRCCQVIISAEGRRILEFCINFVPGEQTNKFGGENGDLMENPGAVGNPVRERGNGVLMSVVLVLVDPRDSMRLC